MAYSQVKKLTERVRKTYTEIGGLAYKSNIKLGIAVLQQKSGVVNMTDEEQERKITVIEQRQATMESDIKEIKADVKEMPDLIVKKVNESTDLKLQLLKAEMENRLSETEKKYQSKLLGLLLGFIAEGVGLVISFIQGA